MARTDQTGQRVGEISTMKTFKTLVSFINFWIWAIGFSTLLEYADRQWPVGCNIALGMLLIASAVGYLWKFAVEPFMSGLRGEQT